MRLRRKSLTITPRRLTRAISPKKPERFGRVEMMQCHRADRHSRKNRRGRGVGARRRDRTSISGKTVLRGPIAGVVDDLTAIQIGCCNMKSDGHRPETAAPRP